MQEKTYWKIKLSAHQLEYKLITDNNNITVTLY